MKHFLLGAFALLAANGAAMAADLYQPAEPVPVAPPPVVVSEASGWYLRGDAGYSFNRSRGAWYFQGSNDTETDFTTAGLRNSFTLGGGVGYQVNSYLRTDLTLDYMFKGDFTGSTRGACGVANACTSTDIASMNALSLLANAYVDLGTYGSITPYVGGGLGGTYVKWGDLSNTSCDDSDSTNCDPTQTHGGNGNWRFTYALMAGASVDLTCNLKADVGYRYRRVEGGRMFDYKSFGGPGYDKGFDSHEGRVGLRYIFSGCEQAYMPPVEVPVAPIVYK
ncbi:outer membrane protein [Gellertiella hungarica]|uniref:Opacity protein-like surface antigen n=1 Tax=Gellertiella hungarica TaxID=1572859 RepID=A0A7W6NJ98_9HYPH|nr:outer membrane protein [Gellertiella hungarica]MBB4063175.1 opacity protein-like surface antigen [Gellertiella hungarica]